MSNRFLGSIIFLCTFISGFSFEQPKFELLFLNQGETGLLIAQTGSIDFISIDAGSMGASQENKQQIKAYLISHPQLDHVVSLIMQSPKDARKNIYGAETTINTIRDHLFNWEIWPNYADEGKLPQLKRYHYVRIPAHTALQVPKTHLSIEAFPLTHPSGISSTAFFIETEGEYFIYIGNASFEKSDKKQIQALCNRMAPLIAQNKCRGIYFEGISDADPEGKLLGKKELSVFVDQLKFLESSLKKEDPAAALKKVKILLSKGCEKKEFSEMDLNIIFPVKGDKLQL